jgi:hypothetical protein
VASLAGLIPKKRRTARAVRLRKCSYLGGGVSAGVAPLSVVSERGVASVFVSQSGLRGFPVLSRVQSCAPLLSVGPPLVFGCGVVLGRVVVELELDVEPESARRIVLFGEPFDVL